MLSLKKYIKSIVYKFCTKVDVDTDFYEDDFYLNDLEG